MHTYIHACIHTYIHVYMCIFQYTIIDYNPGKTRFTVSFQDTLNAFNSQ